MEPTTRADEAHAKGEGGSHRSALLQQMYIRKSEYLSDKTARIKIGSWNVGALEGTVDDLSHWFCQPESTDVSKQAVDIEAINPSYAVDIYVLGLQEAVDVTATESIFKPYDAKAQNAWRSKLDQCLPHGYKRIAEHQLLGLIIYVAAGPNILPQLSSVSSTSVGTGLLGYVGNKGAVGTRLVLGEGGGSDGHGLKISFVDAHLSAHVENTDRRNWDYSEIVRRMAWEAPTNSPRLEDAPGVPKEGINASDIVFFFGDLNYRIDLDNELIRAALAEEARSKEERTPNPEAIKNLNLTEKTPYQSSITSALLTRDQLFVQQALNKAFVGYKEGPLSFPPSYKYDVGSRDTFDSSEKGRAPSWCDRILWKVANEAAKIGDGNQDIRHRLVFPKTNNDDLETASNDHAREVSKSASAREDDVLFENDFVPPETDDSDDEDYKATPSAKFKDLTTQVSSEDSLLPDPIVVCENYLSFTDVVTSDHKPISAIFLVPYKGAIASEKAKVHADIVRELDRAENESRPEVTIIADSGENNSTKGR